MGRLFFLAKFFQEAKHADDFLGGILYANKLSYFKNIEKCVDRGDEYEGGIFLRPHGLVIKMEARNPVTGEVKKFAISEHDLAGPIIAHPRWFDHIHCFACIHATLEHLTEQQSKTYMNSRSISKYRRIVRGSGRMPC